MNVLAISEKLGFDYDEALEYWSGDVAALKEKLSHLREDADFGALAAAVEKEDAEAIQKAAHKVRKAAEKVCLKRLEKAAETVEKAKDHREKSAFEVLRAEWEETVSVIFPEAE